LEDTGILKNLTDYSSAIEEKRAKNIAKFFDKLKNYEGQNEDSSVFAVSDWIDLSMELG
jgi:DNA helicase-2/ATP-dependent DNA helicase PcrA